jgi:hypothetical protein
MLAPAIRRSRTPSRWWLGRAGHWLGICLLTANVGLAEESVSQRRAELDAQFQEQLNELGHRCDQLGLDDAARVTRAWMIPRDPSKHYFFLVPDTDMAKPALDAPEVAQQWYGKFRQIRSSQASSLWQLARDALAAERPELAYRLLYEVLREDPDFQEARRVLGYRRINNAWRNSSASVRVSRGRKPHPEFGWRAGTYWTLESEHYQVETNHRQQDAAELAQHLEQLHCVWRQQFLPFWTNTAELRRTWQGAARSRRAGKKLRVVFFRNHQEYVAHLQRVEPRIGITLGIYRHPERTAYFYGGSGHVAATWRHEATHQLFHETLRASEDVGVANNFWVIEGVALYMESLELRGDYCTLGGIDASRLQYARYRALNERFYLPLGQLVVMRRRRMQESEDIRLLYSQAAGLTHFMMHDGDGSYRRALSDYLEAVYKEQDYPGTLSELVGEPLSELDSKYQTFLQVTDKDLQLLQPRRGLSTLVLGHTSVTDAGLAHLEGMADLQWLDLAHCNITDQTVRRLRIAFELRQLNLEHTQITSAALETLGNLRNLESLDLSHTRITDDGLIHLAGLTTLTELWLTGTRITDAGLVHLCGMKGLQTLDVAGTQVTATAVQQLHERLPSLKKSETENP